ncbi:MAG: LPS export ABC transporter ATP-binding protein [Rhodospirillaceae bacterium]|nr:MAG: LPS export ABC transporter ATP-binding protein [Rhodospirillaceae bacterium]
MTTAASSDTGREGLLVDGLCVTRAGRTVVHNLSLQVAPGQLVGLLGPNGAGKSTAFQAIIGLVQSQSGGISLNGQSLERLPMFRRARAGLGYMPQDATVFTGLTVRQNIAAVMEIGLPRRERPEHFEHLVEEFALGDLLDQRAETLSGGQRRRLELARTLATRPEIVMLDEPFAGVDPIAIDVLQTAIKTIQSMGYGVLITDHNVRETLALVEHVVLIDKGEVLIEGPSAAIEADEAAKKHYLGENFSL